MTRIGSRLVVPPWWLFAAAALAVMSVSRPTVRAAEPGAAGLEFFERKIRPLLTEQCYSCHGAEKQKGHLRLDSTSAILAGGETGAAFVACDPAKSRITVAVGYQDEALKMPPKRRLTPQQVKDLHATILHLMGLDPEKLTYI